MNDNKEQNNTVELVSDEQLEQERIARIMELAATKHTIKKVVHSVTGHPTDEVYWGSAQEGATCACGAHWTIADMRV